MVVVVGSGGGGGGGVVALRRRRLFRLLSIRFLTLIILWGKVAQWVRLST